MTSTIDFKLAYYSSDRKNGSIALVSRENNETSVVTMETSPGSDIEKSLKPIFIGISEDDKAVLLDPKTKTISFESRFQEDAFAAHLYEDPKSNRSWFMNDGDKETGNDTLNCGQAGSSVTVVENATSSDAKHLATICVGRGHHQASFSYPSHKHPNTPKQAYISNLKDGTVSVIDNDPVSEKFLTLIGTIDLCEPEKEDNPSPTVPNNAFPHGLVFSGESGKLYNLNNGYGTVAVIDVKTLNIIERINFKGHSNLFIPDSGKFVIGRGADRKTDPAHVIAKLSVLNASTHEVEDSSTIPDVYIGKYFFNPENTRLYLTTSSSGNEEQMKNLKTDALVIFDLTKLPKISLIGEVRLGCSVGTLDFQLKDGKSVLMFCSNAADGLITVCNPDNGDVLEKISVGEGNSHSRLWCV